jgi:hypothetical protein
MKKRTLRILQVFSIILAALLLLFDVAAAQRNIILTKNTALYAPASGNQIIFKSGTPATLDNQGRVIAGTLAKNTILFAPTSGASISFKGGTRVTFDNQGRVTTGILTKNTGLFGPNSGTLIIFKGGTPVTFDNQGRVTTGTLTKNTGLFGPNSGTLIIFKGGTPVTFDNQGRVIAGTRAGLSESNNTGAGGSISGDWKFNGNGYLGVINFEKRTLAFDIYGGKPEKITNYTYDSSSGTVKFLRPSVNQPHVGILNGNKFTGTFTYSGGTYKWEATRK